MAIISRYFSASAADRLLRAQYDHRSPLQKTVGLTASLFRQLQYSLAVLYHRWACPNPQQCGQQIEWKTDSQGLVVLLHGLRNDPAAWYSQLSLLQSHCQIDVFAPIVPQRGICSLEEAAAPILPTLLDYAKENPTKPLCILGVSNGSRIATWLETQLRQDTASTPVMVSTIAGIHLGSRHMTLLEEWGLAKWLYPSALRQELQYGSVVAKELLERVKAPSSENCIRAYEFYATTDDLSIPDLDSSLPQLNKGEQIHVVHGHSHDSIVAAVAERQIRSCLDWMRTFQRTQKT